HTARSVAPAPSALGPTTLGRRSPQAYAPSHRPASKNRDALSRLAVAFQKTLCRASITPREASGAGEGSALGAGIPPRETKPAGRSRRAAILMATIRPWPDIARGGRRHPSA